ncbi:MAG: phospholipase A [Limisphaerales bacterium]
MEEAPQFHAAKDLRSLLLILLFSLAGLATFGQTVEPTTMRTNEPTPIEQFSKFIKPYEPIYFLAGPETPAVKFQFSLKVVPFDQLMDSWVQPTVGYTQTSFWDIFGKSSPFYDTSYKPSAFVYFPNVFQKTNAWRLDMQGGYQHESNGKGGDSSRSMNTIYLQGCLQVGDPARWHASLTPRAWFYILDLSDNPDIANYRGYANVAVKGGWEKYEFGAKLQMGEGAQHVGVQVDLSAPLLRKWHFMPYFHIQYWNGYGETLLGYNKYTQSVRFGLGLFE